MKICFKCKQEKPYSEFYKHKAMGDGYLGKCKDCTKADVKTRYQSETEKIKEYDRKRAMLPHRVEARKQYQQTEAGKASLTKANRKYFQTHKTVRLDALREYRTSNPEKYSAHLLVNNAVANGSIVKPSICEGCGKSGSMHGHHNDYTKPLEVEWLCPLCHRARHKNNHLRALD